MKTPHKILLFAVSLICLGFSVCVLSTFYAIPYISTYVAWYMSAFTWTTLAFAGFALFICLCFLLLALAALLLPNKSNELLLQKSRGRLLFSKRTVESTVRYSFADVDGINLSKVRVKLGGQPEKMRVYVKLAVNDSSSLVGLTEKVQEKIEAALKSSLDVTPKTIDIKAAEFDPDNKTRKEIREPAAKESRVL